MLVDAQNVAECLQPTVTALEAILQYSPEDLELLDLNRDLRWQGHITAP